MDSPGDAEGCKPEDSGKHTSGGPFFSCRHAGPESEDFVVVDVCCLRAIDVEGVWVVLLLHAEVIGADGQDLSIELVSIFQQNVHAVGDAAVDDAVAYLFRGELFIGMGRGSSQKEGEENEKEKADVTQKAHHVSPQGVAVNNAGSSTLTP